MVTMGRKPLARKTALGKRLLALRERLGLTQREAAEKVGVTLNAWQKWEAGRQRPTESHLKLIDILDGGKLR